MERKRKMGMEKISVIVPTYKSPEALDLCLRSAIEGQNTENQIIVIVDGFYDLNKDVLDKYKDNIDILNLPENVGLCRATNLGVYNARYGRILIVNDDNVFPKDWDLALNDVPVEGAVISPNQIEPTPSMFPQFHIEDMGRDPKTFELEHFTYREENISHFGVEDNGSTLPIFMKKIDFIKVGGWDENYQLGVVADWDFFLKCQLSGLKMLRTYSCHFYHFVSLSTNVTPEQQQHRKESEVMGHEYAKYKWGHYISHDMNTNLKTIPLF